MIEHPTSPTAGPVITGSLMLCDFAQSIDGKLYIFGGGWNQVQRQPGITAFEVTVAIKLDVPWDLANHRMVMVVQLLTDQGEVVDPAEGGPIRVEGEIEVARGLGLRQGTPLISALVIPFRIPELDAGGYVFELRVRDRIIATEPFTVA